MQHPGAKVINYEVAIDKNDVIKIRFIISLSLDYHERRIEKNRHSIYSM